MQIDRLGGQALIFLGSLRKSRFHREKEAWANLFSTGLSALILDVQFSVDSSEPLQSRNDSWQKI